MESLKPLFFLLSALSLWLPLVPAHAQLSLSDEGARVQTYIVHVQKPKGLLLRSAREREEWHKSFLPSLALDSGEPRLVYSYEHAIGGFAARLTPEEAEAMEAADGVLGVEPDEELKPRTTYSSEFLGLTRTGQLWDKTDKGRGMVIGVMERGFESGHRSFSDDGMPPPPPSWRGNCEFYPETCNNKLIGYKFFNASGPVFPHPVHGTHVASIASGIEITGADYRGEASGTASGTAPLAHLAFYNAKDRSDYLAAIDQAIDDGIDVLSISIGVDIAVPFPSDSTGIAALSATKRGIFVSVAAGNRGPAEGEIYDNTPWTLSVGASTTDRVIRVQIKLGNGDVIDAETANGKSDFFPVGASFPAVALGNPTSIWDIDDCETTWSSTNVDVRGKAVLCRSVGFSGGICKVEAAGGKAMILLKDDRKPVHYSANCGIPTVTVAYDDVEMLREYVATDPKPTLSLEPMGTLTGILGHPSVPSFSARGPSPVNNMVLKPDILGPGVNILAADGLSFDGFAFLSGTSMAAPHLSGIAAMLRSLHPSWSPAMIKSAMMTTADWQDNIGMPIADETGLPASLHATGSGQVNATGAVDPGLVYDIQYDEYTKYVCGMGFSPREVAKILREQVDCDDIGGISGEELNYPSFYVKATPRRKVITRTLMNVGRPRESYTLSLNKPSGVFIDVSPRTLDFHHLRQNLTYRVTVIAAKPNPGGRAEGQLTWVSSHHRVRSPIAIKFA